MRIRRKPKPKITPRIVIKGEWSIVDPYKDARELAAEVLAWEATCAIGIPPVKADG